MQDELHSGRAEQVVNRMGPPPGSLFINSSRPPSEPYAASLSSDGLGIGRKRGQQLDRSIRKNQLDALCKTASFPCLYGWSILCAAVPLSLFTTQTKAKPSKSMVTQSSQPPLLSHIQGRSPTKRTHSRPRRKPTTLFGSQCCTRAGISAIFRFQSRLHIVVRHLRPRLRFGGIG